MNSQDNAPNTRTIDVGALVKKLWGKEWNQKETAYEFSNERKFVDPGADGGAYASEE